ncbi:ogr/Delta-like zinc finger family protein [Pantoea dispersa]
MPVLPGGRNDTQNNRKHPQLSDVYCQCTNLECRHTFVMNVPF